MEPPLKAPTSVTYRHSWY